MSSLTGEMDINKCFNSVGLELLLTLEAKQQRA